MPLNSHQIKYIVGDSEIINNMANIPALPPFDENVIEYLNTLSKALLKNNEAKQYADIITFAFWCRKASILEIKKNYPDISNRIGRGVAFHIAPSNVAVNFAYSLVSGLLSGNANIVRIPSKEFEQVRIICNAIKTTLNHFISSYICLIQYNHNQDITKFLSFLCDIRVIWGGDQTISTIRKSPLKPRSTEITFADRYSICVIHSDEYVKNANYKEIARGFYNDTYLNDQNACTSPRIIIWYGNSIQEAQDIFWNELYSIVCKEYNLQPVQSVNKYANLCRIGALDKKVTLKEYKDNLLLRIHINELNEDIVEFKGNSGFFMEYEAVTLDDILPICTSQCQTLSYYGFNHNELSYLVTGKRPRGIDRIIPIGKTLDFSLIWDGYDLIRSMTRIINIL